MKLRDLFLVEDHGDEVAPDRQRQRDAAARLGHDAITMSFCDWNAMLANEIADLKERLKTLEEKSQSQDQADLTKPTNLG